MTDNNVFVMGFEWLKDVVFPAAFLFLAFAVGTVQGTQLLKMFLPKGAVEKWLAIRPKVIFLLSVVVGMGSTLSFGVDFLGVFKSLGELFELDPLISQMLSGLGVTLAANGLYDKYFNK